MFSAAIERNCFERCATPRYTSSKIFQSRRECKCFTNKSAFEDLLQKHNQTFFLRKYLYDFSCTSCCDLITRSRTAVRQGEDNLARKISTVFNHERCVKRLKIPVSRDRVVRPRCKLHKRNAKPRNDDREIIMTNPSD